MVYDELGDGPAAEADLAKATALDPTIADEEEDGIEDGGAGVTGVRVEEEAQGEGIGTDASEQL